MIISSLLAMGIFYFLFYSETNSWPNFEIHWLDYIIIILLGNIGGTILYLTSLKFNLFLPWNKNRPLRFIADILSGLVLFLILALLFVYINLEQIVPLNDFNTFWTEYWNGAVKLTILLFGLMFLYSLISFSVYSYNQYAVAQIESLRIEKDQLNLQFEALKSQLNPHFLFNALNTISSLIYRDIKISEDYIRKLSATYRYILKTDDRKLIELSEEIKMVDSYFFMQKIKNEDYIQLEIKISPDIINTLIPPLTLQMLIENALKHNLISDKKTLLIEVFNEDERFIVVRNNFIQKPELLKIGNNLVDRPQNGDSHKIGLTNIKKRYNYFANKDIDIIFDEKFTVKLPVIKNTN